MHASAWARAGLATVIAHLHQQDLAGGGQHGLAVFQDDVSIRVREARQEVLHHYCVHSSIPHSRREWLAHFGRHKAQTFCRVVHPLGLEGALHVHAACKGLLSQQTRRYFK